MHLSLGICTRNRAGLLAQTLAGLERLRIPDGVSLEILVVNNQSTDDTDAVLARYRGNLPLRRLFEPQPGKSHALNCATEAATGEYIIWTDDDVFVPPDWLEAYAAAFARWPQAAFFGGPIEPRFEGTPPRWLKDGLTVVKGVYGGIDHGPESRLLAPGQTPYGANLAVRTAHQRTFLFDTRLGPQPGRRVRLRGLGEETDLCRRLLTEGYTGRWVPTARVGHFVPTAQQSIRYIRKYFYGAGWNHALRRWQVKRPFFGRPRWVWKQFISFHLTYVAGRFTRPSESWLQALKQASRAWGMLAAR